MKINEENIKTIKAIAELVVGSSVSYVVTSAVMKLSPESRKLVGKAATLIAGGVLSSMVAQKANEYAGGVFDETVEQVKGIVEDSDSYEEVETDPEEQGG